ncbi:MAG TPA: hypothetical protein VND99_01020 [Candidatus Acidoferrales bacterium]|nr:hypothetical protein [Candidatus Acidoferrales bacterium]
MKVSEVTGEGQSGSVAVVQRSPVAAVRFSESAAGSVAVREKPAPESAQPGRGPRGVHVRGLAAFSRTLTEATALVRRGHAASRGTHVAEPGQERGDGQAALTHRAVEVADVRGGSQGPHDGPGNDDQAAVTGRNAHTDGPQRQLGGADGRPPGDGGLHSDAAGDGEGENPEQAFARFRPAVATLRTQIAALADPTTHDDYVGQSEQGALIFQIGDPADTAGGKNYLMRVVSPEDDQAQAFEQQRTEALMRARRIPFPKVRGHLELIAAYDQETGQSITRKVEGKPLGDLTPANKRAITIGDLVDSLEVIETMIDYGLVPSSQVDTDITANTQSGMLTFANYVPIEQTSVDPAHPVLAMVHAFDDLAGQLQQYEPDDAPMKSASDRFREHSQIALREYFMYDSPGVAFATEELTHEEIRAVYARTLPGRRRLAYEAHVASELHDLALSDEGTQEQRMQFLDASQLAYNNIVYQQMINGDGYILPVIRTDHSGNNLLLINDHFLQARLALAYWPVTLARVNGEQLSAQDRAGINRNLASVLEEMTVLEETVTQKNIHAIYGHLAEVTAMTLLSRQGEHVDTAMALPTSEVRRLHAGPDSTILFSGEGEDHELDIDWKLATSPATPSGGKGEVVITPLCLDELGKMANPPRFSADRTIRAREIIAYTASLLREEGLGIRELTPDETAYLNRVQMRVWERIESTAWNSHGITNLGQRARF